MKNNIRVMQGVKVRFKVRLRFKVRVKVRVRVGVNDKKKYEIYLPDLKGLHCQERKVGNYEIYIMTLK